MGKTKKFTLIVLGITLVFTILAIFILPDNVNIMHSVYADSTTYLPKLYAIGLADLLCIIGVVLMLLSKKDETQKYGILIISVMGFILFIYMILANTIGG